MKQAGFASRPASHISAGERADILNPGLVLVAIL